jgi:probable HAF family extracellular repeat protein
MRNFPQVSSTVAALMCFVALVAAPVIHAAEAPPSFELRSLGTGSPVAVNNQGTVIGLRTVNPNTNNYEALISTAGQPWVILPGPAGATSVFPTDLNDSGVIVGVASMTTGRRAIRWTPSGAGYTVALLPLLPGEIASYATGINNLGQVVGARAGILGTPYGFGWIYTDAGGLVDLNTRYGWFATPNDINDNGVILSGTQTFSLATETVVDVGLRGPSNYNAIGGVAINNSGHILGSASLRSSSLNIVSVYHYVPGTGWEFISGSSRYTVGNDINNLGDIGWGEQGAGIHFAGLGNFALGSLLSPAAVDAGWSITGNGCLLNDHRVVATIGRNSQSGQSTAVLLTPLGTVLPPTAPANLRAVSHTATRMEPYHSIDLTWENTSLFTSSYELERRIAGGSDWTRLSLTPPGNSMAHTDTTVGVGVTYEYRVRALGVAGPGAWSGSAEATSPPTPLDTTKPAVTILSPANGATVTGIVPVSAQASDNVAVEHFEISFWNPYLGQEIILGSVGNSGNLAVNWDTRGLVPATYAVRAFAYDTLGNWQRVEISTLVVAPEIAVEQNTTNIPSGDAKAFGSAIMGAGVPLTFVIKNIGNADLTGIAITKSGTNSGDFAITPSTAESLPGPHGATAFHVVFTPGAVGERNAVIHLASNDYDEARFDINLTGVGITALQGWASAAGLPPGQDGPRHTPQNDGLENLVKFAFNLDPLTPDVRRLTVGANGNAGLPGADFINGKLRLEFIRRKAATHPGIAYIPQFASGLGAWVDVTGDLPGTSIDPTWERVVVDDPAPGGVRFGRLKVVQAP